MAASTEVISRTRYLPKLSIDSATSYQRESLASLSSLSSSTRASLAPSFDNTSADSDASFYVVCLFDFDTDDPDQMAFQAEEVLRVVKMEETGWWAAVRPGDFRVGWIPSSYVESIPEDTVIHEEDGWKSRGQSRDVPEIAPAGLQADRGAFGMPHETVNWVTRDHWKYDEKPLPPRPDETEDVVLREDIVATPQEITFYPPKLTKAYPPSPCMPLPPTPRTAPMPIEDVKPNEDDQAHLSILLKPGLIRAESCPASTTASSTTFQARQLRRRPMLIQDHVSLSRLSVLIESPRHSIQAVEDIAHRSSTMDSIDTIRFTMKGPALPRPGKVKQITGDDEAEALHFARAAQASRPWFLRAIHSDGQIKVEFDGSVTNGTLPALVEKLTLEPLSVNVDRDFRHAFLSTFRTLGTADEIFDLLLERYYLDAPATLTESELVEWKARCLSPAQHRVLSVFTTWLEDHAMIEDDPPIARRLQDFLAEITAPPENVVHAQKVMDTLKRLTFAVPDVPRSMARTPPKRRRTKDSRSELLRTDPTTLAENLCLYEHSLYRKVRPQECLDWVKIRTGEPVANLLAFCALHDKVAAWVKQSVLWTENVGDRADLLDHWIKVAEKSRAMRNYTSMSAIVTALSSTVISRLHLTWAHVGKASHLAPLNQLNEPAGSFSAYRQAQQATDTPCVPFIGMYLTDIVHINDQYHDSSVNTGKSAESTERLFNFVKRRKWTDTLDTILAHQKRQYQFSQDIITTQFIEASLARASEVVPTAFWAQSEDMQAAERQRADIRRGLEAAGF